MCDNSIVDRSWITYGKLLLWLSRMLIWSCLLNWMVTPMSCQTEKGNWAFIFGIWEEWCAHVTQHNEPTGCTFSVVSSCNLFGWTDMSTLSKVSSGSASRKWGLEPNTGTWGYLQIGRTDKDEVWPYCILLTLNSPVTLPGRWVRLDTTTPSEHC